jgi:imidazolonepropionase-like amidohydrolase
MALGRRWAIGARGALVIGLLAAATTAATSPPEPPPPHDDPYRSTYRAPDARPVLFTNAMILDGAGKRFDRAELLIASGKVAAVGHDLPRPAGVELIDAGGRWITPGLIDVHTHFGTFTLPQTSAERHASDVTELSGPNAAGTWIEHAVRPSDPGFRHALVAGVTALQILPGSSVIFGGRSVVVKPIPAVTVAEMKFPDAPQGMKMACGGNPKDHFGSLGRAPNSRQGAFEIMRDALQEAQKHRHKRIEAGHAERGKGGSRGPGPREDAEDEALIDLVDGKLIVHVHCYRADDMARMIDLSKEFGFRIGTFHHASEAYKIAPLLAANGVCVATWSDWWGFKGEAEDAIRENAAFVDAANGCVMMHSDIPVIAEHLNVEAAKAAAAGRRAGLALPPEHVISWITSNPAKSLGLDDRIGRLTPGYNADVVLWSGDPFSVYSFADRVYIDGALAFDRKAPARPSDFELGRTILGGVK